MSVLIRAFHNAVRNKSISFCNYSKIAITDNGRTIVALHPEKKFPYERSLPMPEDPAPESKSVLKMDNVKEVMRVFKDMSPEIAREQLTKITLTTKHRWFPRSRDVKRKNTPMDRKYL